MNPTRNQPALLLTAALLLSPVAGLFACSKEAPPAPSTGPGPNLDPLIHGEGLSAKELAERFVWMEFHPLADPRLFFRMRVPRGWVAHPVETAPMEMDGKWRANVVLAQVEQPDSKSIFVQVAYRRLADGEALVTPTQVLDASMRQLVIDQTGLYYDPNPTKPKWGLLARKSGKIRDRDYLEELIELDNQAWGLATVRAQVSQHGPLFFVVMGTAPSAKYQTYRQAFGVAADSFELLHP